MWNGQVDGDDREWRWRSSWICPAMPFSCDGLQVPSQIIPQNATKALLPRPIAQTAERPKDNLAPTQDHPQLFHTELPNGSMNAKVLPVLCGCCLHDALLLVFNAFSQDAWACTTYASGAT
ncbi:MAG: hypothetical protein FRX49_05450 [Trebouxia sp. A1-2]|nr:MAG: hypothetical protein FRX49_05450 [Trebouxia sp. A1-2]